MILACLLSGTRSILNSGILTGAKNYLNVNMVMLSDGMIFLN